MAVLNAKWAVCCLAAFGLSLTPAAANIGGDGPPIPMMSAPAGSMADGYEATGDPSGKLTETEVINGDRFETL